LAAACCAAGVFVVYFSLIFFAKGVRTARAKTTKAAVARSAGSCVFWWRAAYCGAGVCGA
jgi:hypothetical protein